jgi:hypothetical protein
MEIIDSSKLKRCVINTEFGTIVWKNCIINKEGLCEKPPIKDLYNEYDRYPYNTWHCDNLSPYEMYYIKLKYPNIK